MKNPRSKLYDFIHRCVICFGVDELVSIGILKYHHRAIHRGYVRVGCDIIEAYHGKYGDGFIIVRPTLRSNLKGNSFHVVDYYIIDL